MRPSSMLGQNVGEWESTVQRMVDSGCEIGNHSYDHPSQTLLNMSSEEVSSSSRERTKR